MKGTEERVCLDAFNWDTVKFSAVTCPLRSESEVFNFEIGGHERMHSVRGGVWESAPHNTPHLIHLTPQQMLSALVPVFSLTRAPAPTMILRVDDRMRLAQDSEL